MKIDINNVKVKSMISSRGNEVPNQVKIETPEGVYFQSYKSIVAVIRLNGEIELDKKYWDWSVTTSKYRNSFLDMKTKDIKKAISVGEIVLTDLNR